MTFVVMIGAVAVVLYVAPSFFSWTGCAVVTVAFVVVDVLRRAAGRHSNGG